MVGKLKDEDFSSPSKNLPEMVRASRICGPFAGSLSHGRTTGQAHVQ